MTPREHAMSLLLFTRTVSLSILKDYPEAKYSWQTSPADNHPLWVMGHLASTDVWIAGAVGLKGVSVPEALSKAVAGGSKPVADAKVYGSVAEVRALFDGNRAAVLNWLEGATEKELSVDLKEATHGFALDPVDAMFKLAWHEAWHFGQVATLRKAMGLPPVM